MLLKTVNKHYLALILSLFSGLLIFLSFPNTNLYYLAWFALVPVLIILKHLTPFKAFLSGFIAGFISNLGIFYWIYGTIKFNTGSILQSILCLILISSYIALYAGTWALLVRVFAAKTSVIRFSLFSSALWVTLEYLRTYLLGGFPWALLGYSQWKFLPIIQIAEYTGVYGVSFLLVLTNCAFAQFIKTRKLHTFFGMISGFAVLGVLGIILLNHNSFMPPPYLKVAVIQPNIDQYKKWDKNYKQEIIKTLTDIVTLASKKSPDIIIWPETAVPGYLPYDQSLFAWVSSLSNQTQAENLVGAPYFNGGRNYHNASFLFGRDGSILGWHLKTHLIPFGEYVPFRSFLAPYFAVLNTLGDFSSGKEPTVLSANSVLFGTTICSENFFGSTVSKFVRKGAAILVSQTNDAWFFKTSAQKQHFIMNVFRAVENRRPVIVCGNTGISGLIESSGYISNEVPYFTKTFFLCSVGPKRVMTFYTLWGDVFAWACAALVLFTIILNTYIIKRRKQ